MTGDAVGNDIFRTRGAFACKRGPSSSSARFGSSKQSLDTDLRLLEMVLLVPPPRVAHSRRSPRRSRFYLSNSQGHGIYVVAVLYFKVFGCLVATYAVIPNKKVHLIQFQPLSFTVRLH